MAKDWGAIMKTRATTAGLVLVIGMILARATQLQAFSVGDIVVRSHRGAPLVAEVPLALSQQERSRGVTVMLGDRKEYQAEGLTRAEVIDHLDVSWRPSAPDTIRITSRVLVQTPAFDLVLLVRVGRVTIVRTYRVVLPAPPSIASQAVVHASPPSRLQPGKTASPSSESSNPGKAASPPATSSNSEKTSHASTLPSWLQHMPRRYGPVKKGATLFGIAKALGAPEEMIWQTIVLIWQANKQRFSAGNMHGLRSGTYLTIPSDLAEGIAAMSRKKAQRIVAAQWDAWQALRRAVSGRQQVAPSQKRTVKLAEKQAPPSPEPALATEESSAAAKEAPVSPPTVVLPAEHASSPAGVADLQSVVQGLEKLLAQRLPQTGTTAEDTPSFVSTTELQVALQGLEERLMQRLQETLQQTRASQKTVQQAGQPPVERQTLLAQMLPASSMVYVLLVENALLLLLAGGILWRWYRSHS
jgi:Tfp pilus assembly protein FimV